MIEVSIVESSRAMEILQVKCIVVTMRLNHNHNQILGRQLQCALMSPGGDQHPKKLLYTVYIDNS